MAKTKTKFNLSKLSKSARMLLKLAPLATPMGAAAKIAEAIISAEPAGLGSTVHSENDMNLQFNLGYGRSKAGKKMSSELDKVQYKNSGFKMKYKKSSFPFK